ncbi:MAG: CARDB domain-containing protein [Janthinobacterium lividum]
MKNFTFFYKILCLLGVGLLALHPARLLAQSYQLPATGMASYTTCAGTLYDDGGPADPYDPNASGGVTLRPGTPGSKLKLEFTLLEVDSVNLSLLVYDGPDTNAPIIGRFYHGRPTAYATGSTGALTVVMQSYGLPLRGFAATISCVTGPPPPPDVAVQALVLSQPLVPAGDYLTVRTRVVNLAGGLAKYRLRLLLSADATPDAGDTELDLLESAVPAGTWDGLWQRFLLPGYVAPGSYYVLAVAQLLGTTEVNTGNNLAYSKLTVPGLAAIPDLAITALGYDASKPLAAGSTFDINARVQNLGSKLAQSSEVGYYFSADATLSADDQLLGRGQAGVPTDGKSELIYQALTLPQTIGPGLYYLLGVADHLDLVIEANEQNNAFALPLTVRAPSIDLDFGKRRTLSNLQPGAGSSVEVAAILQNEGSTLLDSAAVGYYLSADRLLGADDVLLGRAAAGPLWPGDTYYGAVKRTVTIPSGTPLGRRYLLLVADYLNQVPETDETNNVAAVPLEVVVPAVDLTITDPRNFNTYPPAVGMPFLARGTLANRGTTAVYPGTISYLFSTDNKLSSDDILLDQSPALTLAGGGSQVLERSPVLPANVAPGAYYLLLVADYLNQVAETDETNNLVTLPIQVINPRIDLTLSYTTASLPTRAPAGTELKIAYYVENAGNTPATAPAVGFYLSTDNTLSPDDILIGGAQLRNTVYPSSPVYLASSIGVPRTTLPGRYYVLGVADFQDSFAETDETNNVRATPLDVTAAQPDLVLLANPFLATRQVLAGAPVATESYVNNLGAAPARPSQVGYYLSSDPALSANDVLLGATSTAEVRASTSTLVAGSFVVPATTATGRYYVLFVADYLQQTNDSNTSNNLNYSTISVAGSALAAREQLAGYELRVLPVPVASPAPLRVQLSGPGPRVEATLALYNSLGQAVATRRLAPLPSGSQAELPTTGLAAGIYILRLTGPGLNATRRVVVE